MLASVTETESPWDLAEYEQMEALYIYEASLCSQCGRPLDECRDPAGGVMVDDEVCNYAAAVEVERRRLQKKHDKAKPKPGEPFWSDGLVLSPRRMTDEEYEKGSGRRRADVISEITGRSRRGAS